MKNRRKNLCKISQKLGYETLVAFEPENLFYMTGFWGEAIGILEKNGQVTIIAPALEAVRAREESFDCKVISSERGDSLTSTLTSMVKEKKVGTDCKDHSQIQLLKKSIKRLTPTIEPFNQARMIKDLSEIKILKNASKIIDKMFELCTKKIKPGQTELQLQSILMSFAMEHGLFSTGYRSTLNPLIIAGGPNGSLPHAQVTERKFKKNELVVVDLTLRFQGYVSDATRTFGIGKISQKEKQIYEIVKESQNLGINSVKPNVACKFIDDTCRNFIEKNHYGKYFIHSTGHGIGLEVHESPNISQRSETKLEKNMAITVEPGIYIPKKFGIRIEDSLIVNSKPIILHKFTKELIEI